MLQNGQSLTASLGQESALAPMDSAMEYLRWRLWRVLPSYLLAMLPFSAATAFMIEVITSQHRAALSTAAALLTAATVWRWVGLAYTQRRVQEDLRGDSPPLGIWRRLPAIVLVRLASNVVLVWGSLAIFPAFYAFYLSGISTPVLLEREGSAWSLISGCFKWIYRATTRLVRVAYALSVLSTILIVTALTLQWFMLRTVLPDFLGLNPTDITMTMGSWSWLLCLFYFVFLIWDLYWTVLAVFLLYDLESRRFGTDLTARLRLLAGETA